MPAETLDTTAVPPSVPPQPWSTYDVAPVKPYPANYGTEHHTSSLTKHDIAQELQHNN
jgi:hypothetical protein